MNASRGQPSKREVRRFQWSLRLLLLFTALCAIGVRVCLVPYWREASTARWLAEIGAGTRIAISGPKWLRPITGDRYLERTVHINFLPDCDICDDDLASLRWLSRLETVSFHDAPLGDRGLEHLGRVSSLCGLDLEGTSVSDAGLRHVERLPHLRELRLRRTRVSLRQMEHLARKRPELSIDLALGDNVYRSTSNALQSRHAPIHEVLFRCDANEEWNLLWTKSQGASSEKAAQRVAKRQRASWLEEYLTQVKERDRANATRSSAVDIAALEAALMETQIALARLDDDAEALSLARHRGSKAAKRLLELLADKFEDGLAEPFSFGCVRDLATRLLLSDAANSGDAERRLTILSDAVADQRKYSDRISVLYWSREASGETEGFALAAVDLALAEAALAEKTGDFASRRTILAAALPQAKLLRQAVDAKCQVGALSRGDLALAYRRAWLLELAWARAVGDPGEEQDAWRPWRSMLAEKHHTGNIDFMGNFEESHLIRRRSALDVARDRAGAPARSARA